MSSRYSIPILDLPAQYRNIRDEVRAAIDEVLETQQFILGPSVSRFESQMTQYLGCSHAAGVASGSDALLLALMALDIGPGDGVIVTPFTFFSTVSAITRLGATPLFVDIEPDDYLLSVQAVTRFLSQRAVRENGAAVDVKTGLRIKALLPVHLFGQCCAMEAFLPIADNFALGIVEDVAQACGARLIMDGVEKFAGAIGDFGCFSFFPSKTLGGYGDGGLLTTKNPELAAKVKILRLHGENRKYYHQLTGINSRLDALQAAVLGVKQRYLETWCEQRIARAQTYFRLFTQSGVVAANRIIGIPPPVSDKTHVFNNYVVRV
ncbi:MAG: DegT/DnrJ/EryC1/StrS aminotransferase family protein, partial [Deltaproteobacteria bacterium]|nr:DegT/DnrJ/EryC1/StrS aminotransferase family protein [Deltaproteobacteria bacterium]